MTKARGFLVGQRITRQWAESEPAPYPADVHRSPWSRGQGGFRWITGSRVDRLGGIVRPHTTRYNTADLAGSPSFATPWGPGGECVGTDVVGADALRSVVRGQIRQVELVSRCVHCVVSAPAAITAISPVAAVYGAAVLESLGSRTADPVTLVGFVFANAQPGRSPRHARDPGRYRDRRGPTLTGLRPSRLAAAAG